MWLDLQKPSQMAQELKSNLKHNINNTLMVQKHELHGYKYT